MKLEVHTSGINLPLDLRKHVERRIDRALSRYAHRIESVAVYLRDINGPRGGMEYDCRIVMHVPSDARVVVTGSGAELLPLMGATAERAAFAARRHFNRRRDRRRRVTRNHAAARRYDAAAVAQAA